MTWVDYVVLAIVAVGALRGFTQGIVRQVISILSFSAGYVIASQHYLELAQRLPFVSDRSMANIVAFAIIIVGITAVGSYIGQMLHRVVGFMMFGLFDRVLGTAFGAFMSVLFIEIGLILLGNLPFVGSDVMDSTVVKKFLDFAPIVAKFLPPEFESIRQSISTMQ